MSDKNEPVQLTGKVKLDKPSESKRFMSGFFESTLKDANKNTLDREIKPRLRELALNVVVSTVKYWIYGDKPSSSQQVGPQRISYWGGVSQQRVSTTPAPAPKIPNAYQVGTLYFDDRGDAETVLLRLKENLATYKTVSVADLYEISGAKFDFIDYDYGWRNLDTAYVGRTNDGKYVIELPRAVPLK